MIILVRLKIKKKSALQQWPLFRIKIHKLSHSKLMLIDVYQDSLWENNENIGEMLLLLQIMFMSSPGTVAAECGFLFMNNQKKKKRTKVTHEALDDIMHIAINSPDLENIVSPLLTPHLKHDMKDAMDISILMGTKEIKGNIEHLCLMLCFIDIILSCSYFQKRI